MTFKKAVQDNIKIDWWENELVRDQYIITNSDITDTFAVTEMIDHVCSGFN